MGIDKDKDLLTPSAEFHSHAEERLQAKTTLIPRILCVDDEPLNLRLLEAILTPRGYDAVSAVNGREALEKIRTERIDICLLDVMMPGMDGFEVCRRIKSDDLHRTIPVVMITSFADMENRIRGTEAGAEDFISKPFDSAEVLARIKMLLHVKSLNDRLQSAYHNIAKLSAFGEQIILNFDPVTFDFLENVDSIVHQIIRTKFDHIDSPESVVIGMIDLEGDCQWIRYDSNGEDINRSTTGIDLDCKLALSVSGKPVVTFYNETDPGPAASTLVVELEKQLIPVSNMVSYANDSFCLIALNYGREVTTHDATVINSVVMQGLFLRSLAIQVRDTEYAENIVETVREPLVVLDSDLKILTVNHSFYETFKVSRDETIGNFIYDLGNGQWDIPSLRVLVEEILPHDTVINDYEVEHEFPDIGHKIILLNARQIFRENIGSRIILLAMEDITERKRLETEIQDAREYAENIVETVREPLVVLNSALKILTANYSFYDTFKVTPAETIGKFIYTLGNGQWDIPKLRVLFEEILPHDTVINDYEVEHDFLDIGRKTILLNAREIYRENIASRIILLAMEDITERKLVEERISEVMRQQQAILDNIPNIAWLKNRAGRYVAVNEPFSKELGLAPEDLVGKSDCDIYPPDLAVKYEKDFRDVMVAGTRTYIEESIVDRDGKIQYLEKIKTPIFNDYGVVIGIIGISHDITSRKEVEVKLRHDSTHDVLTGLYNRAFFDEELERLAHGRMFPVSIVMADVNGLKTVNDTLGHEAGDDLIQLAGRIILRAFRSEDIVARIGGDEFAVLLPGTDEEVAAEVIRRIMSCPEITGGQVSIAFGVASAKSKDRLAEALKLSDERMYLDKSVQKKS